MSRELDANRHAFTGGRPMQSGPTAPPAPPPTYHRWGRVRFTGNFVEYFFASLLLLILSVLTLGILVPYWAYWNAKYFVSRFEIEILS